MRNDCDRINYNSSILCYIFCVVVLENDNRGGKMPEVLPEPYCSITDREVKKLFRPARLIWAIVNEMGCDSFIADDSLDEKDAIEIMIKRHDKR